MAAKSPAKPWETSNVSSTYTSPIDSSGTNNSVITPPTPIAKHNNNPHINRNGSSTANPSTTAPVTTTPDTNTNTNTTTTAQPLQQNQQMMNSGYMNNYGGYGGGLYGNNMYGNSMYGNSMYGGMYGNSMYGGMGYGMNGMYGGMGPMGPMGFMQMSVNNVGRFSQLLQVASQALHMTFSSLVQFAGNIGMLAREFGGVLSGVYIFRFLKWLYLKIKKFLFWIIGKRPSSKEQFEEMFQNAVDATSEASQQQNGNNNRSNSTHYSWLSIGFYCFGILYVIQWIYKSITYELNQKKQMEQQQQMAQQQMMNPMNPYQQNLAYAQNNPYGYIQPTYNNGMYGAQVPMIQQPQNGTTTQPVQSNNDNDNGENNKRDSADSNQPSESLLAKPKDQVSNVSG